MLNIRRTTSAFFASTVVLLAGCHQGSQNGVLAMVNGHPIQATEVQKIYDANLAGNPGQVPSPDQADATRLQILQQLILNEIVDQRATKLGLIAGDSEVDAKVAEMKAPYTEEQFQAKLKASSMTLDELRRELRRSLTQTKLLNKEIDSKITVTDSDVANYYNAHKAEFNLPEDQYHMALIQVTGQPAPAGNLQNNKATNDEEARKKIQAIKNRIDTGDDFGTVAANFSENPESASNGGDIGFVRESQLKKVDPVTYNAITKLKAGETTDIIPLLDGNTHKPVGYSIYKLISKDTAGQRDLSDPHVQQAIRQQLHDSRSQLLKSAYFEMLHDQAKIQNFLAEQIFKNAAQ